MRHDDIEDQDLGIGLGQEVEHLETIAGDTDQLEVVLPTEEFAHQLTEIPVVISQQHPHLPVCHPRARPILSKIKR
jgi:hypothetical protein